MSKELYDAFIDLIQFEQNKLSIICSAKNYFYDNGLLSNKKFFKYLYKKCSELNICLHHFLISNLEIIPEFRIPAYKTDFKNAEEPFEIMSDLEDEFEDKLLKAIDIAYENKDWKAFHYLLKKIDDIDHLCCRALAAIQNKANVLDLLPCE